MNYIYSIIQSGLLIRSNCILFKDPFKNVIFSLSIYSIWLQNLTCTWQLCFLCRKGSLYCYTCSHLGIGFAIRILSKAAVTWLKYCRYGVKLYPINQSFEGLPFNDKQLRYYKNRRHIRISYIKISMNYILSDHFRFPSAIDA